MTTLRERLEAKQRRKALLPIVVGDLRAAQGAAAAAAQAVQQHVDGGGQLDDDRGRELQAAVEAAVRAQSDVVAFVELQSLDPVEWEALWGPLQPDGAGELPMEAIHATALAASCTDVSLQDVDWWESQLRRPEWNKADRLAITNTLLDLNLRVPDARSLGKG